MRPRYRDRGPPTAPPRADCDAVAVAEAIFHLPSTHRTGRSGEQTPQCIPAPRVDSHITSSLPGREANSVHSHRW